MTHASLDPGTPHPGSTAAKAKGCTCSTIYNNHGVYPPIPASTATGSRPHWLVQPGCPVHDRSKFLGAQEDA